MKKMTQWAAVAASAVLALAAMRTVAVADEHAGKGDRTQQRVERMKERLNLTDDQVRQLQQQRAARVAAQVHARPTRRRCGRGTRR